MMDTWTLHITDIMICTKCELHKLLPRGCTPVPGVGNNKSKLMVIAEAPGEHEINLCEPLVGLAGKTFNTIIESAGIKRNEIYIDNIVHCRPLNGKTKNRPPNKKEIEACSSWILRTLELVKPKVIVTMGLLPTKSLMPGLGKRIKMDTYAGVEVWDRVNNQCYIPCYHPSYLMQYGKDKMNKTIEIFKKAKQIAYGEERLPQG